MAQVVQLRDYAMDKNRATQPAERTREWLERVVRTTPGLTYESWGRKAGIASTSITRFLKHGTPLPKATTLAKLAEAVGLPPPDGMWTADPRALVDVPVITAAIWRIGGRDRAVKAAIELTRAVARHANCVAVRITTTSGILAGVLPGDLVLCDPDAAVVDGDLVVVALHDGDAGAYRVQGTALVPATVEPLPQLHMASESIIGLAVQVQRDIQRKL